MSDTTPETPFFQGASDVTDETGHLILDDGGTNEVKIFLVEYEDVRQKKLTLIPGVFTKQKRDQYSIQEASTGTPVKIVDLLRVERRLNITGSVANRAGAQKVWGAFKAGGTFTATIDSESIPVNIEKCSIKVSNKHENDERDVQMTLVAGADV